MSRTTNNNAHVKKGVRRLTRKCGVYSFTGLFDHCSDAVLIVTASRRIRYVNPALVRFLDCPAAAITGKPVARFLPEGTAWDRLLRATPKKGGAVSGIILHFCRATGAPPALPLSSMTHDPAPGDVVLLAKLPSAASPPDWEEQLQRSESNVQALLSLVAEHTDKAVIITDKAGVTEWVNEGFTRITGFDPAEAIGKTPGALL